VIRFTSRTNDSVNQYSLYQSFTGVVSHSLQFPTSQFPPSVSAWWPLYRSFLVGLCPAPTIYSYLVAAARHGGTVVNKKTK
jgi:hypothetical protein